MFQLLGSALAIAMGSVGVTAAPASLHQRILPGQVFHIDRLIVGRARCGASTWLLTDDAVLIEVNDSKQIISATPVRGFTSDEHPWGLACIAPGALWTLLNYRTLARLAPSGAVTLRTKLRNPWLNVFAAGERLLFQQPPPPSGGPLLVSASVADVHQQKPWPGPTALPSFPGKIDVPSSLVTCGIGDEKTLPCWIRNQPQITVSDGEQHHTSVIEMKFISKRAVDATVPIWDAALGSPEVLWILTSAFSAVEGRRVGGRLTLSNWKGEDLGSVELMPRARMIVNATPRSAVLLTTAGTLVEVGFR